MKNIWKLLGIILVIAALVGCNSAEPAQPASNTDTDTSAAVSSTGGQGGTLDGVNRLALGTLELEDSDDAVTAAQAAELLPLWQVLQGSDLQSDAERLAVTVQIEHKMTETQVAAIAAMQLTQADAQAWAGSQGMMQSSTGETPGNRQMPEGMSEEQIAQMREQFSKQEGAAAGGAPMMGSSSQGLIRAVVALLSERTGKPIVYTTPAPTATTTPTATRTPPAEADALPTLTPDIEATVAQTPTVEQIAETEPANTPAPTTTPMPVTAKAPASSNGAASESTIHPAVTPASAPALEQVEDTDPGPLFTVEVSLNQVTQDPLVEESQTYLITGIVRNDGDQTYAVSDILVTFYDAEGFRGTFQPAIRDGKLVGGEWHWHGETEAEFAALLLAPGEEWPFRVAIVGQDMASFLVHPDAAPTGRESIPVELGNVRLVDEGADYVRISGTATNASPLKAQNVTVSGVLLDANGQIVSIGSAYVLEQDIEPGASVSFDLRIERGAYTSYQLYAQAERDWD